MGKITLRAIVDSRRLYSSYSDSHNTEGEQLPKGTEKVSDWCNVRLVIGPYLGSVISGIRS